ncbi:response regulator transcription factor [Neolewinella persica]|uniref:response regulator transcription factor n=1 Tax=Neolewinella persica TaxID=70998 RepID=UPI000369C826|nr:response regulator transcription factor [Neolewinella persica]
MPTRPPRILIVEDEAIIATEIEFSLRKLGYQIVGKARNGDKALDLLASTKPDLALLDIDIQGTLSGIDLARIIRDKYNYPFVFLTAFSDRATLERVKDTMPYGYIVKPFNGGELLTTIELALHKYAAEQDGGFPHLADINRELLSKLTEREYEILRLLEEGLSYREAGERLFISINTVKYFQKSIFVKLGVNSRLEALRALKRF